MLHAQCGVAAVKRAGSTSRAVVASRAWAIACSGRQAWGVAEGTRWALHLDAATAIVPRLALRLAGTRGFGATRGVEPSLRGGG